MLARLPLSRLPMIILHGENIPATNNEFVTLLTSFKNKGYDVFRYQAKHLSLADVESALGSDSLFQTQKLIVIEHLHSLPRSRKKNELIKTLAQAESSSKTAEDTVLILIEKRSLTKTMLKQFPEAEVREFKLTKYLFKWLESLEGGFSKNKAKARSSLLLFQQALDQNGEYMCLVMLVRQVRMLIQVKESGTVKGPPFMVSKLKKQAASFTFQELLNMHKKVLEIDLIHKQNTHRNLKQDLDLWMLSL